MPIPPVLVIVLSLFIQSCGLEYIVGDSFWSIPPTNDFYSNWSSSHFFQTEDTLYFDFDSGLHNVMQVSSREYESCSADHPFKVFRDGPASVVLMEEGVFYFICNIANYCALGQKFSVVVYHEKNSPNSAPTSSPRSLYSLQPSAQDRSRMPPPASTPYSSESSCNMMDLSVSLVDVKSAGDKCCNGGHLGWFAAIFCLVFYIISG